MQTKEKNINKEAQRAILRFICENPSASLNDITQSMNKKGIQLSKDDLTAGLRSINPTKTWDPSNDKELRKEVLNYVWAIEAQILYVFPTKQKDSTLLDINQMRFTKGQPKITKDVVRTLFSALSVEGKDLAKYRKFATDKAAAEGVSEDVLADWGIRVSLFESEISSAESNSDLEGKIIDSFNSNFSAIKESCSKNIKSAAEKFVGRYFSQSTSRDELKDLIEQYKTTYKTFKDVNKLELTIASETQKQSKLIEESIEKLSEVKDAVSQTSDGGAIGKLLSGKVKNKDGVTGAINDILSNLKELSNINRSAKSTVNEKSLLLQKAKNDLETTLTTKGQVEAELKEANDQVKDYGMKNSDLERELSFVKKELNATNKEIADLNKKLEEYTNIEVNNKVLRDEIASAKEISVKLHTRLEKLKDEFRGTIPYSEEIIEPDAPKVEASETKSDDSDSTSTGEKEESEILENYVEESKAISSEESN